MALKDTVKHLKDLLTTISHDLDKADNGNKAASQRVRTGTVRLEKIAKAYRKESIKNEKSAVKSPKKTAKKVAPKTAKRPVAKASHTQGKSIKAKGKTKAHRAHGRALSVKKPSAKIPSRKTAAR
jgi:hypothetical protein